MISLLVDHCGGIGFKITLEQLALINHRRQLDGKSQLLCSPGMLLF